MPSDRELMSILTKAAGSAVLLAVLNLTPIFHPPASACLIVPTGTPMASPSFALDDSLERETKKERDQREGKEKKDGTEIYPQRPVSLALRYNVGYMNATTVPECMATLRLHLGPVAPYAGYHSWSTGATTLRGGTAGLEVYFQEIGRDHSLFVATTWPNSQTRRLNGRSE